MPIIILAVVFFIGLGCGAALWLIFKRRRAAISKETSKKISTSDTLPLRWRYIILPLAILTLSIILSAYVYHLLPTEVAYHFKSDGTPDKWFSRGIAMGWVLIPQFSLTLLATATIWGITKLNILSRQTNNLGIRPEKILSLMGNFIALPQLIIGFAMLDIFGYNVFQIHVIPIRPLLLVILGLATIGLGLFLVFIILKVKRQLTS